MSRRVLVRNQLTNRILPCCWSDCEHPGDDRCHVDVPHDQPEFVGEQLRYIFCSERHRAYWINSRHDLGNLRTGDKGLLGPLGLPL